LVSSRTLAERTRCGGGGSSTPSRPGAPGNLTATAGDGQVDLGWTAGAGATSYTVSYHELNAPEAVHQQAGLTSTASLVTGLLDNVPYVFSVAAVNGGGSSAAPAQAATPLPAVSLESIAITPASPTIGWPVMQPFKAVGTYSDGSMPDITSSVQWFSDDTTIVMADGGNAESLAPGTAHISAHLDGVASNAATITSNGSVLTGTGERTTTTTQTTSATTVRVPMDVQSPLEDGTWATTQETITQQPAHGVATVAGLIVNYVPAPGYSGPDSIVVQETSVSGQIIVVGDVVLGSNVNTNTNTNTITISVE